MKDALEVVEALKMHGQNFINFHYADDAVFLIATVKELQPSVGKIVNVCKVVM